MRQARGSIPRISTPTPSFLRRLIFTHFCDTPCTDDATADNPRPGQANKNSIFPRNTFHRRTTILSLILLPIELPSLRFLSRSPAQLRIRYCSARARIESGTWKLTRSLRCSPKPSAPTAPSYAPPPTPSTVSLSSPLSLSLSSPFPPVIILLSFYSFFHTHTHLPDRLILLYQLQFNPLITRSSC